ncbi:YraN family protein [Actinomycetospora sp. TBRC 11914]|nr:YraN family protein [Actinomycetospora sp. TBRC 11914]
MGTGPSGAAGGGLAKDELGREGERLAAEHLVARGLVILARNWRRREGELDVVATDGKSLVVCEVKTRSGVGYGLPVEAVTRAKAARIRRLAHQWLAESRARFVEVRFDVVAVLLLPGRAPQVEHYEGAF